jgi:hypothetical protein
MPETGGEFREALSPASCHPPLPSTLFLLIFLTLLNDIRYAFNY